MDSITAQTASVAMTASATATTSVRDTLITFSNVIHASTCPNCEHLIWLDSVCPECGLSHGEARIKAGEDLCLCGATRYEPDDGSPGWSTLHRPLKCCPPDRGVPPHAQPG